MQKSVTTLIPLTRVRISRGLKIVSLSDRAPQPSYMTAA